MRTRQQQVRVGVGLAHGARAPRARPGARAARVTRLDRRLTVRRSPSRPRHQSAAAIALLPAAARVEQLERRRRRCRRARGRRAARRAPGASAGASSCDGGRLEHLEPRVVDVGEGARLGRHAADAGVDAVGGLRPVDPAVLERRASARASARRPAATATAVPVGEGVDDAGEQGGARRRRARRAGARGLRAARCGCASSAEHGAGVELGHELEHGGAGLAVAGDERALHGRGAAPARQQREVQVDPAEPRRAQQRLAHEPAVGDDDARGRAASARSSSSATGVEPVGLDDREAELSARGGDRRRGQHALAAQRRVLARDDGDDLVRSGEQAPQARDGGGRAAGEDEPQRLHARFCPPGASLVEGSGSSKRARSGRRLTARGARRRAPACAALSPGG